MWRVVDPAAVGAAATGAAKTSRSMESASRRVMRRPYPDRRVSTITLRFVLETLANRFAGREYLIELEAPEFTSICPLTGGPDFGELTIRYVPNEKLYELKALR